MGQSVNHLLVSWFSGAAGALISVVLMLPLSFSVEAAEPPLSLQESVTAALQYHPQLKALNSNLEALGHETERARGGYFPKLDLVAGYGAEVHDDIFTRAVDKDTHSQSRTEASLNLTQLLFDGFETSSRVGVQRAKERSGEMRVIDNAESIALDAIIAHLEIFRQQELLALAEKNVDDHKTILGMISDRQKGGVGSIADVVQTEGRYARARASLAATRSNLRQAQANYLRITGILPSAVLFEDIPEEILPKDLEVSISRTRENNPKVGALDEDVVAAGEQIRLAESEFFPTVNLELATSYEDQVESSESYEKNHRAMIRLRWNLFNGASDHHNLLAAGSRRNQAIHSRDDEAVQVMEETRATWAEMTAAQVRVAAFQEAVDFNEKTLDAYLKQFRVAQRTLLDVLDAVNELFQSSGQLVTEKVNQVIAGYRLQALAGSLNNNLNIDQAVYLRADRL